MLRSPSTYESYESLAPQRSSVGFSGLKSLGQRDLSLPSIKLIDFGISQICAVSGEGEAAKLDDSVLKSGGTPAFCERDSCDSYDSCDS